MVNLNCDDFFFPSSSSSSADRTLDEDDEDDCDLIKDSENETTATGTGTEGEGKNIMSPENSDLEPPKDTPFKLEDLKPFDGSDPSKPIYVSIKGASRLTFPCV